MNLIPLFPCFLTIMPEQTVQTDPDQTASRTGPIRVCTVSHIV